MNALFPSRYHFLSTLHSSRFLHCSHANSAMSNYFCNPAISLVNYSCPLLPLFTLFSCSPLFSNATNAPKTSSNTFCSFPALLNLLTSPVMIFISLYKKYMLGQRASGITYFFLYNLMRLLLPGHLSHPLHHNVSL